MKLRGKKCLVCGAMCGTEEKICATCDSTNLIVWTEEVDEDQEIAFWEVTVTREVKSASEAFEFQKGVTEALESWKLYYNGHRVELEGVIGDDDELSLMEMIWYFGQTDGAKALELQSTLYQNRSPGLMDHAEISLTFYDDIRIRDDG